MYARLSENLSQHITYNGFYVYCRFRPLLSYHMSIGINRLRRWSLRRGKSAATTSRRKGIVSFVVALRSTGLQLIRSTVEDPLNQREDPMEDPHRPPFRFRIHAVRCGLMSSIQPFTAVGVYGMWTLGRRGRDRYRRASGSRNGVKQPDLRPTLTQLYVWRPGLHPTTTD